MNAHKQRGMVLLVSLILLLMLTLIAITASSRSTLQLRISSNSEQRSMAFQAAEAGISQWVGAYLNFEPAPTMPATIGTTRFDIVTSGPYKSRWDHPCTGASLTPGSPEMLCFDVAFAGESVCDGSNCEVSAIHRQGGQRRGEIKQ